MDNRILTNLLDDLYDAEYAAARMKGRTSREVKTRKIVQDAVLEASTTISNAQITIDEI